jgi:hypothetical protein
MLNAAYAPPRPTATPIKKPYLPNALRYYAPNVVEKLSNKS